MIFPSDAKEWPGLRDVSCETIDRLKSYVAALDKWNKTINLVSPATMPDVWVRHVKDSAQLWNLTARKWSHWVDIGSGGGLPGLVISILAKELAPTTKVTLIESDQRKAVFLRAVARDLDLTTKVITDRVERVERLGADVMSARALAPLKDLLPNANLHLAATGEAIFPKGRSVDVELAEAKHKWSFDYDKYPSSSDPKATVLVVRNISRA